VASELNHEKSNIIAAGFGVHFFEASPISSHQKSSKTPTSSFWSGVATGKINLSVAGDNFL
jgi:hypothetical protein